MAEGESLRQRVTELAKTLKVTRPSYEAARIIVAQEDADRQAVLAARAEGADIILDPELFPASVFNDDGTRKTYVDTGLQINTPAEDLMFHQFSDG